MRLLAGFTRKGAHPQSGAPIAGPTPNHPYGVIRPVAPPGTLSYCRPGTRAGAPTQSGI